MRLVVLGRRCSTKLQLGSDCSMQGFIFLQNGSKFSSLWILSFLSRYDMRNFFSWPFKTPKILTREREAF